MSVSAYRGGSKENAYPRTNSQVQIRVDAKPNMAIRPKLRCIDSQFGRACIRTGAGRFMHTLTTCVNCSFSMSCLSSWVPVHFSATAAFILVVGSSQLHTLLRREVAEDRRNNAMARFLRSYTG